MRQAAYSTAATSPAAALREKRHGPLKTNPLRLWPAKRRNRRPALASPWRGIGLGLLTLPLAPALQPAAPLSRFLTYDCCTHAGSHLAPPGFFFYDTPKSCCCLSWWSLPWASSAHSSPGKNAKDPGRPQPFTGNGWPPARIVTPLLLFGVPLFIGFVSAGVPLASLFLSSPRPW